VIVKIAIPVPHSTDQRYSRLVLERFSVAINADRAEFAIVPSGLSSTAIHNVADLCHAVLLPGTPADIDPARYGAERSPQLCPVDEARDYTDQVLLEHAFHDSKPVLGVCHGLQALNVFAGGTLLQGISMVNIDHAISEDELIAHEVLVEPKSGMARKLAVGATNPLRLVVNSNHHQAVDTVGRGLKPCAKSSDGIVEAIEGMKDQHFILGVQWHPEGLPNGFRAKDAIFSAFMDAACEWHLRQKSSLS
jgi:putative glutamine amidotransferase